METAKGKTREEIITKLADRIDSYKKYSRPHSRVTAEMAARLARRFGLVQSDVHAIAEAALLLDIGLYAMNPSYNSSPGPLSFEERLDLWRHPIVGEQQMAKREATRQAQLLVRWHHEWWNGSGYPDKLAFEDIPIGARILRAVELYSSLICDRPYRPALSPLEASEALRSAAGTECDPFVVQALLALLDDLNAQAEELEEATNDQPPVEEPPVSQISDVTADVGSMPEETAGFVQPEEPVAEETRRKVVWVHEEQAAIQPEERIDERPSMFAPEDPEPLGYERALETAQEDADSDDRNEETDVPPASNPAAQPVPQAVSEPSPEQSLPPIERLLAHAERKVSIEEESEKWRGWGRSRYNKKSLLGFEISVLREIEFRSIATAFSGWARLDWYLKSWGRLILSNDPRAWAAAAARAMVESRGWLDESQVSRLLEDVYVPGVRLANPELRRWFSETDAWWLDNLRCNIEEMEDETLRAQAIFFGLETGDYALSFDENTQELKRPLTNIFWRLAGRALNGPPGHPHNRTYNLPAEEFIANTRADLLYINLPSCHAELSGSEARNEWRNCWTQGPDKTVDDVRNLSTKPQSKQSYLSMVDRMLAVASHLETWAIEYQEVGLASARDISELIKEHREVRATYSKDLTEVAGGLRNYIIVAER